MPNKSGLLIAIVIAGLLAFAGKTYVDNVTKQVNTSLSTNQTSGTPGAAGDKGEKGDAGSVGAPGSSGLNGLPGSKGLTGAKGSIGATGPQGLQGNPGLNGDSLSGIQYVDVQLNNDQILNLKASPVELIPAPGDGFAIIPVGRYWILGNWTAPYTQGIGGSAFEVLGNPGGNEWFSLPVDLLEDAAPGVSSDDAGVPYFPLDDSNFSGRNNQPIFATNLGSAEWEGGAPGNTLSIRIWYSIVPTVPFD